MLIYILRNLLGRCISHTHGNKDAIGRDLDPKALEIHAKLHSMIFLLQEQRWYSRNHLTTMQYISGILSISVKYPANI